MVFIFYFLFTICELFDPLESLESELLGRNVPNFKFREVNNILSFLYNK
jgi:hypothetical protein